MEIIQQIRETDKILCKDISIAFEVKDKKTFIHKMSLLFTDTTLSERITISNYLYKRLKGEA